MVNREALHAAVKGRKESDMIERPNNSNMNNNINNNNEKNSEGEYCTVIESTRVQSLRYFGQFLVRQKKAKKSHRIAVNKKKKTSLLTTDSLLLYLYHSRNSKSNNLVTLFYFAMRPIHH